MRSLSEHGATSPGSHAVGGVSGTLTAFGTTVTGSIWVFPTNATAVSMHLFRYSDGTMVREAGRVSAESRASSYAKSCSDLTVE